MACKGYPLRRNIVIDFPKIGGFKLDNFIELYLRPMFSPDLKITRVTAVPSLGTDSTNQNFGKSIVQVGFISRSSK
jgi:hypothetical protein